MNPFISSALLMFVMAGGQPAQSPPVAETILLHHLEAQKVPGLVQPVSGLQDITINYRNNSVLVRGDTQTVKAIKAQILALDVQPVNFRLIATVTRYRVAADGRYSETVVMSPTMMVFDKSSACMAVTTAANAQPGAAVSTAETSGFALSFKPTHNADGSITLLAEVQELGEQGEVVRSGRNERRVAPSETARVVGMTDGGDKAARRRAMKGEAIRNGGPLTGYYVQARADILDDRGRLEALTRSRYTGLRAVLSSQSNRCKIMSALHHSDTAAMPIIVSAPLSAEATIDQLTRTRLSATGLPCILVIPGVIPLGAELLSSDRNYQWYITCDPHIMRSWPADINIDELTRSGGKQAIPVLVEAHAPVRGTACRFLS